MSDARRNTVLTIPEPGTARLAARPYPRIAAGYALVEVAIAPVCNEAAEYCYERVWRTMGATQEHAAIMSPC